MPVGHGLLVGRRTKGKLCDKIWRRVFLPHAPLGFDGGSALLGGVCHSRLDQGEGDPATAPTETEDKVRGLEAGAVDYVTKLLDAAELLARVNTHLKLHVLQEELRQSNAQLTHTVKRLQAALAEIRTLQVNIPICTICKRIRNDTGFWQQVEVYIQEHCLLPTSPRES